MTSFAMETSLMNLRTTRQEVSGVKANPLATKTAVEVLVAIQTLVGQVNNEFPGDVMRKIRLEAVSRLHGDSACEISGGNVREKARTKSVKVTSTAG